MGEEININRTNQEENFQEALNTNSINQDEKKENKLRNLFNCDETDSPTRLSDKKIISTSSILFNANNFPDLDEPTDMIQNEANLENCEDFKDETNISVMAKNTSENKKGARKKKKFVALDVDILRTESEKSINIPQNSTNKKGSTKSSQKAPLKKK